MSIVGDNDIKFFGPLSENQSIDHIIGSKTLKISIKEIDFTELGSEYPERVYLIVSSWYVPNASTCTVFIYGLFENEDKTIKTNGPLWVSNWGMKSSSEFNDIALILKGFMVEINGSGRTYIEVELAPSGQK